VTVEIIAELAQGFEGKPGQARLLLKAAASAGADAAKFQLVYADELATPDYKYYDLFRSLEMSDEVWEDLADYASELSIQLHLDIFGKRSLQLAERLGVAALKLHGTDIANLGLLKEVASSSVPKVLLGAGGAYSHELYEAIGILAAKEVVILLGFQGYPTPDEANQIARVRLLVERHTRNHFNVAIGFADHAAPESPLSYALPAMAISSGATVLEKHLTLSKAMKLEDHESALNPDEFLKFTQIMRVCAQSLGFTGDGEDFGMSESEQVYRKMIRRHVVASRDLEVGMVITPSDLTLKRTSAEQAITDLALIYQKTISRSVQKNMTVSLSDLN
jgi:sialic acid synthase SpsE